jgi:hypothetical protein
MKIAIEWNDGILYNSKTTILCATLVKITDGHIPSAQSRSSANYVKAANIKPPHMKMSELGRI